MELLPNREGGIWHDEQAEVHVDEHDDHGHDHGEFDMHVWLYPGNAGRIAIASAIRLEAARAAPRRAPDSRRSPRGQAVRPSGRG